MTGKEECGKEKWKDEEEKIKALTTKVTKEEFRLKIFDWRREGGGQSPTERVSIGAVSSQHDQNGA